MEFFELISQRHSIRVYWEKPIPEGHLIKILSAANKAPSAGNLQAYQIYWTSSKKKKAALANAAYGQSFIAEASLVLCFCINKRRSSIRYHNRGENLYSIQDATIATTYAMLAAESLGLSSCWVGAFNDQAVQDVLEVTDKKNIIPVAILPIGYAREKPHPSPRRSLEDLVSEIN
ncbi:MAG: nitroreductase family protein [Promethearchaeota archaeon]